MYTYGRAECYRVCMHFDTLSTTINILSFVNTDKKSKIYYIPVYPDAQSVTIIH